MARKQRSGLIIRGRTSKEVVESSWQIIQGKGVEYQSQRGLIKSIKGVTLIVDDPLSAEGQFPYWDEQSDNWYQDNFVRKETNQGPEKVQEGADIYPYKYVWRSRYYDAGWGYIAAVVAALKGLGWTKLEIANEQDLRKLLLGTYKIVHPETLLSVIAWKGRKLIDRYLQNQDLVLDELSANRIDTLLLVTKEIKDSPTSRRAITPSFGLPQIDFGGAAGGVPVYQNYQLQTVSDKKGNIVGFTSTHWHRALDAKGGVQLDISHDRDWGMIAVAALNLPLLQMTIFCTDMYYHVPTEGGHKDLINQTNVRDWLHTMTEAYKPATEDIEARLARLTYQEKIKYALDRIV